MNCKQILSQTRIIFGISSTYVGYENVGTCVRVCSPKVVSTLRWFLAYKYIFKSEMYISERKLFKKIYGHHFKNSSDIQFHSQIAILTLMFLIWICYVFM